MKVHPGEKSDEAPRPRPPASFQQVLRVLPRPVSALAGLRCQLRAAEQPARVRAAPASSEGLRLVRQGLHAEAQRLGEVRSEHSGRSEQRHQQRATELIARELVRELSREAPPVGPARSEPLPPAAEGRRAEPEAPRVGSCGARTEAAAAPPEPRAEAALALIERIELFVRSQRPAMALSVGGALEATVEVERTGPREVALRIQGRRGPPLPQELELLRTALEARGLQLRSLQVS